MREANFRAGWRYIIETVESCQLTRYRKGGFYGFHSDGHGDHLSAYKDPDRSWLDGYVRKLSMTIVLNDNFEGGAFEFATLTGDECFITPLSPKAGTVLVFPSYLDHRVVPVIKGVRYSLTTWFLGPPFV